VGKLFITTLSKKRSADTLTFEMKLRDSLCCSAPYIRDSTYKYVIVNRNLLLDKATDPKPMCFYDAGSGASTSTIAFKNETLHLTRGRGDASLVGPIHGSYLEKVGMIESRSGWRGGMTSESQYFTLLKFNNEAIDTSYIFSKEAVPLIRPKRIASPIRSGANGLMMFNGRNYHVDGKPVFGIRYPETMAGSPPPMR
jgi:hypothetical protein